MKTNSDCPKNKEVEETVSHAIDSDLEDARQKFEESKSTETYNNLGDLLLCNIIFFNRKRGGDVGAMTVEDYEVGLKKSEEQEFAKKFLLVMVVGKRQRINNVLVDQKNQHIMNLLHTNRQLAEVENQFFFPRNNKTGYPEVSKILWEWRKKHNLKDVEVSADLNLFTEPHNPKGT